MKIFNKNALLSMIGLAVILMIGLVVMIAHEAFGSAIIFLLGIPTAAILLILDIIIIISYVLVRIIFKKANTQQTITYTIIAIVIIIAIIMILMLFYRLQSYEPYVHNKMLKLTPIGTSMEDVIKVIESKKKWQVWDIDHGGGRRKPLPQNSESYKNHFIESKSINVLIGEYMTPFTTSVTVRWKFDDDLKLIDIEVRAETDSF